MKNDPTMTLTNFAAAQERILERRRLREAEARSRISEPSARLPAAIGKLPYPLSRASDAGILLWDTIKGREGTKPAFRVGQVDAELLDEELLALLKSQVGEGLKYFGVRCEILCFSLFFWGRRGRVCVGVGVGVWLTFLFFSGRTT